MAEQGEKLVLVVHGIGEQGEGESVDALVGACFGRERVGVENTRVEFVDIATETARQKETFPCHIRKVQRKDAADLTFAEVYWADLSKGASSWFGAILELCTLILGLGYIVRRNTAEKGASWPLRWASRGFVYLLHGPMLSSLLFMALFLTSYFALLWGVSAVTFASHVRIYVAEIAAFFACLVASIALLRVDRTKIGYLFSIFLDWIRISSVVLMGAAIFSYFNTDIFWFQDVRFEFLTDFYFEPQKYMWFAMITLLTFMVIGQWIVDVFSEGQAWRKTLYPITAMLMTVFFLFFTALFWAVLLTLYERVFDAPSNFGVNAFEDIVLMLIGGPSFVLVLVLVVGISTVMSLMWRMYMVRMHQHYFDAGAEGQMPRPVPRMIVSDGVYWTLFLLGILIWGLIYIAVSISKVREATGIDMWEVYDLSKDIVMWLAAVMLVLYPMIWERIGAALGTGKDIVGYFSVGYKEHLLGMDEIYKRYPARLPEYLDPFDKFRPLLRDRINGRLIAVLRQMTRLQKYDEVIIIAHSQGTVVAYEALQSQSLVRYGVKSAKLVTMGSPLYHIYARYFPSGTGRLTAHVERLTKWINIYRVDDYVGTHINDIDGTWPENHCIPPGGHIGYWTDQKVIDILHRDVY